MRLDRKEKKKSGTATATSVKPVGDVLAIVIRALEDQNCLALRPDFRPADSFLYSSRVGKSCRKLLAKQANGRGSAERMTTPFQIQL